MHLRLNHRVGQLKRPHPQLLAMVVNCFASKDNTRPCGNPMRYVIPCVLLALTTCLYADEPKSKAIRKYENEVEVLRKQGQAAIKRLEGVFEKEVEKLREKTLKDLQKELDAALESKDLDKAVGLREEIKTFEDAGASGLLANEEVATEKKVKKRIPRTALNFKGHKYAIQNAPMFPNVAADYAESLGGHLLRIESAEEWDFVRKWLNGKRDLYVDGSDQIEEGSWVYSEGTKVDFRNVKVVFNGQPAENFCGFFEDHICDLGWQRLPFIIEWD